MVIDNLVKIIGLSLKPDKGFGNEYSKMTVNL